MNEHTYQQRLRRLREVLPEQGLGLVILTPGAAMRYLTGFSEEGYERLLALIVPQGETPPLFVAPALYADQVRLNPAGIEGIRLWEDAQGWQGAMGQALTESMPPSDGGGIGLDDVMPARFTLPLERMRPQDRFTLADPAVAALRAVKDAEEREAMRRAAQATDALLPAVYTACRVGATELEVAQVIHDGIAKGGYESSFSPIIGAGAHGAVPHHQTGHTELQRGDVVVLDLGVKVDGYCGDITRTVALGAASEESRRVYETVYRAHQAGVQAVRPGATGHDVDAAARRVIAEAGYGEYFIHRTGHGIGLDDHEPPYIVAGNHAPLRPGECFSIEPGIYLHGQFGVRLENIVTVGEDGTAQVLNNAIPAELTVLP